MLRQSLPMTILNAHVNFQTVWVTHQDQLSGLLVAVSSLRLGGRRSIPRGVIPKTITMGLMSRAALGGTSSVTNVPGLRANLST